MVRRQFLWPQVNNGKNYEEEEECEQVTQLTLPMKGTEFW